MSERMRFIGDLCLEQEHGSCTRPDCECTCHGDKRIASAAEVLGGERVKLRDAVALLRDEAPAWPRYQRMTAKQLGADLGAEGVRTVNVSGTMHLDPADLRRVLLERSAEDPGEGSE